MTKTSRKRVVVIGGGFAGLAVVRGLASATCDITLVDRTNHHCFQPLLYQVATAGLSPGLIAPPLRNVLRRQRNVRVLLAGVDRIDRDKREVQGYGADGSLITLSYDILVVAAGARHGYFGHPEWEQWAPGLKTIDDALEIKGRILAAFEHAELCDDEAERKRLLTFVVVGAGPTGVELAGQIAEMSHSTLRGEFRTADPSSARIVLADAADRALLAYDKRLSRATARSLAELGVELRVNAAVTDVTGSGVTLGDDHIEAATVLWAAGVQASPLGKSLASEETMLDRAGRVPVDENMRLAGHPEVFVLGDMASMDLPGVAPVAMQQGSHTAKQILAITDGEAAPPRFTYVDKGSMATIGRRRAVVEAGRLRISGTLAWLMWLFVHLTYLVGFANRIFVVMRWTVAYMSAARGERAIHNGDWIRRPNDLRTVDAPSPNEPGKAPATRIVPSKT